MDKDTNIYKKIYLDKFNQNLNLSSKILSLFTNKKINYHSALIPGGLFYMNGAWYLVLQIFGVDCCSIVTICFGVMINNLLFHGIIHLCLGMITNFLILMIIICP